MFLFSPECAPRHLPCLQGDLLHLVSCPLLFVQSYRVSFLTHGCSTQYFLHSHISFFLDTALMLLTRSVFVLQLPILTRSCHFFPIFVFFCGVCFCSSCTGHNGLDNTFIYSYICFLYLLIFQWACGVI
jgi:hypothetical protein